MIWGKNERFLAFTRYNNKTYRIDDIDWSVKPTHTFQKRDGTEITYVDYYKQVGLFPFILLLVPNSLHIPLQTKQVPPDCQAESASNRIV